ncbi:MAG: hypothetical protein LAN37_09995 [Acidobacteriia bacterium]|nr:hypothetical protein [Terriglobia bacterium]
MAIVQPQTVYVDDSGTEPNARIVVAAFCVSPVRKWKQFEAAWIAAEDTYGFKEFHMTEFAGCRRGAWCRDCLSGKTDATQHPWRDWSNTKRHNLLTELLRIVCKYTQQGFGIAFTKEEIDGHVQNPRLQELAPGAFGRQHFTFAATTCGGELAKWRAKQAEFPPIKFVFDLCNEEQKLEIAKAFVAENQVKPRIADGVEHWFDVDGNGISFESRKKTRQLLSADMLAWVTAKIRAAALFPTTFRRRGGWGKEVSMVAFKFVDSGKLNIGYNTEASLRDWLDREIKFWEQHEAQE